MEGVARKAGVGWRINGRAGCVWWALYEVFAKGDTLRLYAQGLEEDIQKLMKQFLRRDVHSSQIIRHLEVEYPEEYELIINDVPEWVKILHAVMKQDDGDEAWHRVGGKKEEEMDDDSMYTFWRRGMDLDFLRPLPANDDLAGQKQRKKPAGNSFAALGDSNERGEDSSTEGSSNGDEGSHPSIFPSHNLVFSPTQPSHMIPNLAPWG